MYLYLIRNTVNGKGYVGMTTRGVQRRFSQHMVASRRESTRLLVRAVRKYGREAFTVEQLGEASTVEKLMQMECEAIATYNTFWKHGQGYNMTLGGEGARGFDAPKSLEHRQKIGDAQRGEKNHRYGKHCTEAHKQILRDFHRGRQWERTWKPTPEQQQRLRTLWLGGHHTPEAKEKIAASKRGIPRSPEVKAKLSEKAKQQFATKGHPMQGRTLSEEARRKISERQKGRRAWNKGVQSGPLSAEHRQKLSVSQKKRQENYGNPMQGKTHSLQTKAKMAASHTGGKNWLARALEYDSVVYPSMADAIRATGLTRMQMVYRLEKGEARYLAPTKDRPLHKMSRALEVDGIQYPSVGHAARALQIPYHRVKALVKQGRARYLDKKE